MGVTQSTNTCGHALRSLDIARVMLYVWFFPQFQPDGSSESARLTKGRYPARHHLRRPWPWPVHLFRQAGGGWANRGWHQAAGRGLSDHPRDFRGATNRALVLVVAVRRSTLLAQVLGRFSRTRDGRRDWQRAALRQLRHL